VLRGAPTFARLEEEFEGSAVTAQSAYALSYRAVTDLAALDPERGLTLFFRYWKETSSMDLAVRRAFGVTLAGFETDYRARTRRTYGVLALFADLSLVFVVLSALMLPFFVARRRRDRQRLRDLLAADAAAERAERASALAMLLGGTEAVERGGDEPER